MGFTFTTSLPPEMFGTPEYMREYGAQRKTYLAERAGFVTTIDDDGAVQIEELERPTRERGVSIVEPKRRIEFKDLGISPKKAAKAALDLGWQMQAWLVVNELADVIYVNDSEEGAENQHRAGDVRYPRTMVRRYVVEARHPDYLLGFQGHWSGAGLEGKTASFDSALIRDPVGVPIENWVDYTKDKVFAKELNWTEEQRVQYGMAMNNRINDGTSRKEHILLYSAGRDFTLWLDDWLKLAGMPTITTNRKPKAMPEEREQTMLGGGDWNG